MHPPRLARLFVPLVLGAALALAGGARAAAQVTVDKGIVQSVSAGELILRTLDGSTVALPLGPETRYRLNGVDATLADLRPGLVASVTHDGSGPARLVRAFGTVKVVERGTVESVSRVALTLRRLDGTTVTVGLAPSTAYRKFGRPAKRGAVRPGRLVRVTYVVGKPASLVAVVRRFA